MLAVGEESTWVSRLREPAPCGEEKVKGGIILSRKAESNMIGRGGEMYYYLGIRIKI